MGAKSNIYTHTTESSYCNQTAKTAPEVDAIDLGLGTATRLQRLSWLGLFAFTKRRHIPPFLLAIFSAAAAGALSPLISILLGDTFNHFTDYARSSIDGETLKSSVSKSSIRFAALAAIFWLLNAVSLLLWVFFGELQVASGRALIFDGLTNKPVAWYDTRKAGISALLPRIQTQLRELQLATSQPLGYIVEYISTVLVSLGIALYSCWNLTLVIFAAVPVSAVLLSMISASTQSQITAQKQHLTAASKTSTNAFTAIENVKCFNAQDVEVQRYMTSVRAAAVHYLKQARSNALQISVIRFITITMFVQGFWYGSHLVFTKQRSPGTVITTFWACLIALTAMECVLPQLLIIEKGKSAGAELRSLISSIHEKNRPLSLERLVVPGTCIGDIEFSNVTFRYPSRPQNDVLRDVNLFIAAGETTFIIGPSGSGKSTLSQLLLGLYEASAGHITLNGHNIADIDKQWLRRNITLVEQETVLFDGSIRDNIRLANLEELVLPAGEVEVAARFALLQSTTNRLVEGLDTPVGPKGDLLSGGQRQRVAIARAYLRDTPVLILDESTSALDQTSRSILLQAVRKWRKNRTTIIISHEVSQIANTDYVYSIEDGQVVFEGFKESYIDRLPKCSTKESRLRVDIKPSRKIPHKSPGRTRSMSVSSIDSTRERSTDPLQQLDFSRDDGRGRDLYRARSLLPSVFLNGYRQSMGGNFLVPMIPSEKRTNIRSHSVEQPLRESLHDSIHSNDRGLRRPKNPTGHNIRHSVDAANLFSRNRRQSQVVSIELENTKPDMISTYSPTSSLDESTVKSKRAIWPMIKILRTAWPSFDKKHRALCVIGFLCALMHAISTPMFAWAFSKLLNTMLSTKIESLVAIKWSVALLSIAAVDSPCLFSMHYLLDKCGQRWVDVTRKNAISRILAQPRQFFVEGNDPGKLSGVLDQNAEEMRSLLGKFAAIILMAVTMILVATVWSFIVSWRLTLVMLAVWPIAFAITRLYQTVSFNMEHKTNIASGAAATIMYETFSNIKTVRALTLEQHFGKKHQNCLKEGLHVGIRRAVYTGALYGLSESLSIFAMAAIVYYGAVLISSDHSTVQNFTLVTSMLIFSMGNLTSIMSHVPQIEASKDNASLLLTQAHLCNYSHEHIGALTPCSIGDVVLSDVSFAYPSRPADFALRHVSMKLRQGTYTAIVGLSGSGKSTIANLLLRLYPFNEFSSTACSKILISGKSINAIETSHLRTMISIVSQSPMLVPDTVAENIAYGLPNDSPRRSMQSITTAAAAAGIDEFVQSLPQGYHTLIGSGGTSLSGGQKQRLAIARALLRQPSMLILDEATSALDVDNAELIKDTIARLHREAPQLSIVVITHSRHMMELADYVYVMDRGQVVESGPFDKLLEETGALSSLLAGSVWRGHY